MKDIQAIGDKLAKSAAGDVNSQILQLFQQQRLGDVLMMVLIENKADQTGQSRLKTLENRI